MVSTIVLLVLVFLMLVGVAISFFLIRTLNTGISALDVVIEKILDSTAKTAKDNISYQKYLSNSLDSIKMIAEKNRSFVAKMFIIDRAVTSANSLLNSLKSRKAIDKK